MITSIICNFIKFTLRLKKLPMLIQIIATIPMSTIELGCNFIIKYKINKVAITYNIKVNKNNFLFKTLSSSSPSNLISSIL